MRYQLIGPWPIGAVCLEAGEIIETGGAGEANRLAAGRVPPPNVTALDQEAYDLLAQNYEYWQIFSIAGLDRHADPAP